MKAAIDPRSDFVLAYLAVVASEPADILREAQAAAQRILEGPEHSETIEEPNVTPRYIRQVLRPRGEWIALDLGLLLARLLLERLPDGLRWEIGGKPKSDVNYGMPILKGIVDDGFAKDFNPLTYALGLCAAALQNRKHADALARAYERIVGYF